MWTLKAKLLYRPPTIKATINQVRLLEKPWDTSIHCFRDATLFLIFLITICGDRILVLFANLSHSDKLFVGPGLIFVVCFHLLKCNLKNEDRVKFQSNKESNKALIFTQNEGQLSFMKLQSN